MKIAAHEVKSGDRVRTNGGDVVKVLCSNPERQSAASASAAQWHIEGYAEGRPTHRILCDPSAEIEVVR